MLSFKVGLGVVGIIAGGASAFTGMLASAVPALTGDTPVTFTLALTACGLITAFTLGIKISRAWAGMEARLARLEEHLTALEKGHRRREPDEDSNPPFRRDRDRR